MNNVSGDPFAALLANEIDQVRANAAASAAAAHAASETTTDADLADQIAALRQEQNRRETERRAAEDARIAAEEAEAERLRIARREFARTRTGTVAALAKAKSTARSAFEQAVAEGGDIFAAWISYRRAAAAVSDEKSALDSIRNAERAEIIARDIRPLLDAANGAANLGSPESLLSGPPSEWVAAVDALAAAAGVNLPTDRVRHIGEAEVGITPAPRRAAAPIETFAEAFEAALSRVIAADGSQFEAAFTAYAAKPPKRSSRK